MTDHGDSELLRENDELATELAEERLLCNRLREALQETVDLCNAMREYAPAINLAAEKQLRESLELLNG